MCSIFFFSLCIRLSNDVCVWLFSYVSPFTQTIFVSRYFLLMLKHTEFIIFSLNTLSFLFETGTTDSRCSDGIEIILRACIVDFIGGDFTIDCASFFTCHTNAYNIYTACIKLSFKALFSVLIPVRRPIPLIY